MSRRFWAPLILVIAFAQGQEIQPTIRVEVRSGEGPVQEAEVSVGGHSSRTGPDGVAISPGTLGRIDIGVTKKGFFPARASLDIDAAKEWTVQIELQPQKEQVEKLTVHATRNDVRVQDSPLHVEVISQDEINEELAMRSSDISMLLNEMGGIAGSDNLAGSGSCERSRPGHGGAIHGFLVGWAAALWAARRGSRAFANSANGSCSSRSHQGERSALYGGAAMAGVVNLIARRPTNEPIHEFLFNWSSLGETDGSMFLASQLTPHWGASFLGGEYFQKQRDVNGDGWADVAGYSRGVFRPRLYWDNQKGATVLLAGGVTYEDRSGGTISGAVLPATNQPYIEALRTARYDVGGNANKCLAGVLS